MSVLQMSAVFSAFTLAYSIFEVPSGWMGDVFGPRLVLTRIVLWWSGFTMLTGAAWNYASLLVTRFLFGAGEAGAFPNMARAFSRWFPACERGKANGILFVGSRAGGALAPVTAFLLIDHVGWRRSFVIFGAIGVMWAVAWYRWYRDEPSDHPSVNAQELQWIRQDHREAVVHGSGSAPHRRSNESAGACDDVQIPWRAILTSRNLYAICGMYFAFGYGLYFYFTWLPTYLLKVLGFSAFAGGLFAGLPFVLAGAANVAGGSLTDRLARRYGLRVARCWLGCVCFAGSAVMLVVAMQTDQRIARAVLIALALASADFALSACWAVCLDVGRRYAGIVTGFMNTFGNLGGFLGPMVVGYAVTRWNSWAIPFYISAVVYAMGAALWLTVDPDAQIEAGRP